MGKQVMELCERFRQGLVGRREFVQKVILTTGSVVAAGHALRAMGFDAGLIQEARAEGLPIVESTGQYPSGGEQVDYFLARPTEGGPFSTMIVIHENQGLREFERNVARKFARQGFLALAPDVLGFAGRTTKGKHADWMLKTMETGVAIVPDDEIDALNDGYQWVSQREDVDAAHIGSVGFCWGGARSFTLATRNSNLWAAVVFYGSSPPYADLDNITAPVLGLYGALDNNSPTSITGRAAETAREMRTRGKIFEWEVYNRAPHGFFRAPDLSVSEERPAVLAWELLLDFLERHYKRG